MNTNYDRWINGNGCCGAHNFITISGDCKSHDDACSCENILLEISKLWTNDEILQEEIDAMSGGCECDLSDYYTKEEVDALIPTVPSLSGYATEQWVLDKHYLTEHQPLKTINNQVITGTGNIEITASGGTINIDNNLSSASTNPVANSAITEALNSKLDASAYTPVSLSGYATEQWVLDKHYISGVDLSDYALKSEIPTVPTSNSAFTNDMHYITSADTVFNNYALTANTYTKTEVDNKFWCGTQAEYDALSGTTNGVLYLIHD